MSLKSQPTPVHNPASPLHPLAPAARSELAWGGLYGSSCGLAVAQAAQALTGPVLLVTATARAAQQIEDEIRFYLADSELPVLPFPDWESLPYDAFSPHQDIVSQRLLALHCLPGLRRGIVLVPITTLMNRLAPRAYIEGNTFLFNVGDALNLEGLRQRLQASGYHNVTQVMAPGEFAVRGGLVDLFPMGAQRPFRLDLFGEEIESIREFDPETQLSLGKIPRIELLPAREYPLTPEAIQQFRQAFRARFEGDPQRVPLYREVSKGMAPAGIEYYLPLFFEQTATFFDYLPADTLCILDDGIAHAAQAFEQDTAARYESLRHDLERPLLPPQALFLSAAELLSGLAAHARVRLPAAADSAGADTITYDSAPPPQLPVNQKAEQPYAALFQFLHDYPGRILVVAETAGRREVLRTLLVEHDFRPTPVTGWSDFLAGDMPLALACAELEKGLLLRAPAIAVITEPQLYGERAAQRRRRVRAARDPEAIIRDLGELKVGDPVVHDEHGVGRYLGLQALDIGGALGEFLTLEYAGGDKLYIPVTALHLITRYTGTDPEQAPLHKLGTDAWDKAKRRAREKAHDAAAELLELYALRAARQGHAFSVHSPQYHSFAAAFPFEETPDQTKAIEDVLADMEQAKPMDRLVCGDVGFGKTEVAMRAAFLAVHDRHQVAVLVPTTLLAAQHYQNFRDRFADLAVNIELLSRFRTKVEQDKTLADLADGRVDIIIGTHRLLQDDVQFRNLGLVIIDEEHRFGVRQKERLKKLRSEVDVLTLTATPVPRTLNLALSGLRDVSLITTAPQQRLSIKTFVTQWNDALIREACLRELRRGGQVFFLHNDVKTMTRAIERLRTLVPEADIRMAHGQMPERELEQVMLDFYHQRFNILVCSTIIETGIDIPTANTIIIERADKFGLAQLHQLRGRVGRSHHRAYAYLLVPSHGLISADAQKRLDAISSLEDLGVGFALASHDLEIRGAGELLGEAQSGQIDEVGFAMYSDLLNRAVESLRMGRPVDFEAPDRGLAELNLHVPALLPDDYIPDPHMRLILYKRIAGAKDNEALDDLEAEIIDRFGLLPEAGKMLFKVTRLKLMALPLGVRKIEAGPKGARIEFCDQPNVDPARIIRLLQLAPRLYKLDGPSRMRIMQDLPDGDSRIEALRTLLQKLTGTN